MKRSRSEHIQTAVLNYLKKRNYTDSEATFKQNFKLEETLLEMTSRVLRNNKISKSDSVSFSIGSLDDYFHSFLELKTFVEKCVAQRKHSKLKGILFPVFIHSFLDLLLADRSTESTSYLRRFGSVFDQSHRLLIKQIENLGIPQDQANLDMIEELRNCNGKIVLTDDDQLALKIFLQTQENLSLMKIINDRIQIVLPETDDQLNLSNGDFTSTNTSPQKVLSASKTPTKAKVEAMETAITNQQPIIISPPSVATTTNTTPSKHSTAPPVASLVSDITIADARKIIDDVRKSPPALTDLTLIKFKGEGLIHATPSQDHSYIATGFDNSTVKLWRQGNRIPDCNLPTPDISCVHLGSDALEDVYDRLSMKTQQDVTSLNEDGVVSLHGHSGPVYDSCFTSDNKFLITCAEDSTVRLWDMQDLKNKVIYDAHNRPVWCVDISAYDLYFATGSADHTARLWTTERTYPLRTYAGHQDSVGAIAFHGNCSYLATADRVVRVWDVNSGKPVRVMTGHWAPVMCVAFSSNGRMLASAGEDYRIRLWDVSSGNLVKEMRAHTDTIYSLAFNYDGSLLASCGADCSVYCWNTATISTTGDQKNQHLVAQWSLPNSTQSLINVDFKSTNKLFCYASAT
uniref:TAF5-like RNA polymerase II p300/CBP-associated factor-associated factor 65 kDa subunit 5L n=1 Tax=Ciona intestinalis TaxID=7719 RepID=UPI00005232F1|nr:TAF5-like RNA polymerase II p300/CBP-associated factor-associated factor 65 kDa subunit 5L [Ciona intestinalis]|eukprot:XP_002120623.1 TAF5-like RNA polymerase II p300/CBP-associated factor-associated factor 65 kDa subunit 5L [Ciona intestinalis]